jgi:hypothetical protein
MRHERHAERRLEHDQREAERSQRHPDREIPDRSQGETGAQF